MKKILILSLFAFGLTSFAQQSLTLSFEARHYQGQDIGLDSILIKNINRNCDTILFSPDTVLYYNFYVGTEENKYSDYNFISQPYPNPTKNGVAFFNANLINDGLLYIELYDFMGINLISQKTKLLAGNYKFQINIPRQGNYIFKAIFRNKIQSMKIINNTSYINGELRLDLLTGNRTINLKTQNNNSGFWYEPGDTLWYIGYAETPYGIAGSDVLEGVPINKEHRRFTIVEGLPCPDIAAVRYAGNLYPTVEIFGNCWFKENLNVGTMIVGDSNMTDNGVTEKYCYDNEPSNCKEYGGLYQWDELMNYTEGEATQGICPEGWHIPTSDEYFSIVEDIDGLACKERGNEHWLQGFNVGGDNTKGFTALGSGYRQNTSMFEMLKKSSAYHSSTLLTNKYVWYLEFNKNYQIFFGSTLKKVGNSVRCVKDD